MKIDLNELEALARAATPGPWEVQVDERPHHRGGAHFERRIRTSWEHGQLGAPYPVITTSVGIGTAADGPAHYMVSLGEHDAAHIAAANPAAVLELIALARQADGAETVAIPLVSGEELLARTAPPVKQPAPTAEPHYEAGRKQGRAEALAILLQLDPECGIDEYTGWSTPVGPEDEGAAYWEEEKLRELFGADSALADMMDRAEAEYWKYLGMQNEAERAKNFAVNMHNSGRVREVLAKAGEFDLMGELCTAAPVAAPVDVAAANVQPDAEAYSDMLREFFCQYAAGGYNDNGGLLPLDKCRDKLAWIIEDQRTHATVQPDSGRDAALEEAAKLVDSKHATISDPAIIGNLISEAGHNVLTNIAAAIRALAAHPPANVAQVGELSDAGITASAFERAAQACDQQADSTNGPYRSACLQCADAVRTLRDKAINAGAEAAAATNQETPP